MTPELRPITKLTLTSVAALLLLATPLSVDRSGLNPNASHAETKGDKDGSDSSGGFGGAVGAVGDAAGAVADSAADAVDGSESSDSTDDGSEGETDSSGASEGDSDSGSAETDSSEADSAGESDSSGTSESGGSATGDDSDGSTIGNAADTVDGAAIADESDSMAESEQATETNDASVAPDSTDAASPATDTAVGVVEDTASPSPPPEEAEAAPEVPTGEATDTPTPSRAVSSPSITVAVITMPRGPGHGDRSDKRPSAAGTATVDLLGDASSSGLAAIEPSAGPVLANPAPPAPTASIGCTTDEGQEQGTQISCLVAGSKAEVQPRQVAYAPPEPTIGRRAAADRPTEGQIAPTIAGLPRDPGLYDEIYGLQQVEARRYADGDVPVLIVQGIVSNMSNGQRSVPPLLAIVQDEQGKELLRWTFRAEAETLGPGGSTGFRSEMFDPQSESAKVTIVFAAEQQATP